MGNISYGIDWALSEYCSFSSNKLTIVVVILLNNVVVGIE